MSLAEALLQHFRTDSILVACKRLVEDAFPTCVDSRGKRDVVGLAASAGIQLRTESTHAFDGCFESNGSGNQVITLTRFSGRSRTRFTLAHELGHWLLRRTGHDEAGRVFRGVSPELSSSGEEERLADLLAAEILMPVEVVAPEVQKMRVTFAGVRSMSKRFDVSFRAMLRRVADLTETEFLYLSLIPFRFRQLESFAEVDDAYHVRPLVGLVRHRENARLVRQYRFADIARSRSVRIGVVLAGVRYLQDFDVRYVERPIPNCDLLATVGIGVRSPIFK